MLRMTGLLVLVVLSLQVFSQTIDFRYLPKKGSYSFYGQPAFEDNSFLIEEAINQEKGVMQYSSNFYFDKIEGGNFLYSFTQEIPITHLRHQLNYSLFYHVLNQPTANEKSNGFGDLNIGYHYMATGKNDWAMVVPGFTLIVPTGNSGTGLGAGGWGGQLSLAVTKRLSHKIVTHYNLGYTFISQADRYSSATAGNSVLILEKDIQHKNIGASVIWYQARKFNWLLEYTSYFLAKLKDDGSVTQNHQLTLNPGFRFAIDHNFTQIVPGVSAPFIFMDGKFDRVGLFFYLSFEPQYLPFSKPKSR